MVVAAALLLALVGRPGLHTLAVVTARPGPPAAGAMADPAIPVLAVRPYSLVDNPRIGFAIGADSDLRTPSGLTALQIDHFLQGTHLGGLGSVFLDAEEKSHVNARYLIAHAIEESAWGSSDVARDKHNLYGYGAIDSDPYGAAASFTDFAAAIEFQGRMVARDYLRPGGAHWGGAPTLNGMHRHYATDPRWVGRILAVAVLLPA